jgi:hypothetical protein
MHFASVQFKCFSYFRGMLQVFHADIAKIDRDVAKVDRDVAIIVHVGCKRLSPMFYLFFHTHVASVFISMLHMFPAYVVSVYLHVA